MFYRWQRKLSLWTSIVLVVLGAIAFAGDLVLVAARLWYVCVPLLLAVGALVYWSLGPADHTAPPPLTGWREVAARLGLTVALLIAGALAVGLAVAVVGLLGGYAYVLGAVVLAFAALVWLADRPDKPAGPVL